MAEVLIFTIAFVSAYIGVEAFRRWSLRAGVLDVPNDRSSHNQPTPRGAGLVIVAVCLVFYVFISLYFTHRFEWGYVAAASLIALISWLDDLYSVPVILRLFVHAAAAGVLIGGLGFVKQIYIPGIGVTYQIGNAGAVITFFWIVWMINAYNFMDGIDGLAGSQAVIAGLGWLVFGYIFGYQITYLFGGVLALTSFGFLIHNWSPAKVFMGDVGSAFLGITFAAIPLMATHEKHEGSSILFAAAISFLWFFIFDTGFTFVRRVWQRQKVWTAHREHLYQRMFISGMSHRRVTLIYGAFTASVIISYLTSMAFSGIWEPLLILYILLLSAMLIVFGHRKKTLTSSV